MMRIATILVGVVLVSLTGGGRTVAGAAQANAAADGGKRVIIPYLANATKPEDLDFAAAECDISANGEQMTCRFRQVFLTASGIDRTACVITTNGYEQLFRRDTPIRWVSAGEPAGECGFVETTTLDDGGTTRWTMTLRTTATLRADQASCQAAALAPEVYDWRSVKRRLPCASIQPGAIER